MKPKENFGNILRRIRESRGLSIRALASRADVHHSHLARIERCEAKPSLDLVQRLSAALEAPILYFAFVADNLPSEEVLEKLRIKLLQAQEQTQIEPANKSYPAEDPMLAYAHIGPKPEGTIYTTDEYIDIWEFNRFPVDWLSYIPPLRDKIINADIKWREQQVNILAQISKPEEHKLLDEAENAGYFAGYREAIQDTIELLRQVYQEHGLYWLLAVVLIPPQNARVISDFYSELEALNFDECAVRAVFDLLRAWKDRYYQNKEQDQNQETSSTENKGQIKAT